MEANALPKEFLNKRVEPVDVEKVNTTSEMLRAFNSTSFQSRNLARCADIYVHMLQDPAEPTIFIGLAGAMIPAGMKKVISTLVKKNMVDVIVSTGANTYHDLAETFGYYHYMCSLDVNDAELHRHGIDRIYDTLAEDKKLRIADDRIAVLADEIREKSKDTAAMSSREFLYELGGLIEREGNQDEKQNSVIWNCWKHKVPIFVPALCDSSIGLAITQHYIRCAKKGVKPVFIDQFKDNYEIFEIKKASKKTGVIYIGGGVPKNYIQQTSYLEEIFNIPNRGHDYGFQITTDRPEWGGLSGCTFNEGISWGKEKTTGEYTACYCDATIAFPIIVKAALERLGNKPPQRKKPKEIIPKKIPFSLRI
jgi:deoxyhypusine synthase